MINLWDKPKYLNDIFRFKSNRRVILLSAINEYFDIENETLNEVLESFECLHFSATTVDDVLDNETFRNNQPCYYIREGYDKSFVAAFSSFVHFLEISSKLNGISKNTISYIREMIIAEEADSGLRTREMSYGHYDWYYEICSTKSSNEISAIISILNNIKPIANFEKIKRFFFEIGRYAQMYNDKRDIITSNPLLRFSKNDEVKLTYSLPLAIYLEKVDNSLETKIGTYIKQSEFLIIHKILFSEFIQELVIAKIKEQHEILIQILNLNSELNRPATTELFSLISKDKFYNTNCHEILSK